MLPSTLDMVPSTLDMEPSTLDPRQKDRLAYRDSLPLFGRSKFSSRSAKLTSSLVGNVIVYPRFLTFSSIISFSVIRSKPDFLLVWWYIFVRELVSSLLQWRTSCQSICPSSSISLVCYTKKLFRTNSWLTLCFTFPIRNSEIFIVTNFLQGSVLSQHVQSTPLFIRHRSECFLKLTP